MQNPAAHPELPPAILLLGPTASGKTALALQLAERLPVHLISVDSALVYRDMDIGTAKPDAVTLQRFPHALVDIITPEERYSAARFCSDALAEMHAAHAVGKIPLLVGGTMLYAKALLHGLADLPASDPELRAEIDREAALRGWPALHAELARLDPETAARLAPGDSQRIQRALEVVRSTSTPLSQLLQQTRHTAPPFDILTLALLPSQRAALHERIHQRLDAMFAAGFIDEVRGLQHKYRLHPDMPSMRCVGYRQVWTHLEQGTSAATLHAQALAATRQLAKRQITWLGNSFCAERHDCLAEGTAAAVQVRVERFLEQR